jgi:soluble lytic murein transglycosylase
MWTNWREPAEFVESIPFPETREYVQAVLRNADMYRELYADKPVPKAVTAPEKSAAKRPAKAPVKTVKKVV